ARASSYSWSVPNPSQVVILSGQGTNSITVQFNGFTGTGSIAVLASNNCGSSAVRRLTITSTPARPGTIVTNGPVCEGVPVNYSVQAVPGASGYTWSTSIASALISGQNTPTILVVWPSNIQSNQNVSVFAYNACSNSQVRSQNTSVSVCSNRSTESLSGSALVFPNPARDRATLQFESAENTLAVINLFDLTGRLLWNSTQSAIMGINRAELDFGSAPAAGVYFVELRINDAAERIRVIIE
ncbi:MAG: T9SS type A sorting domain-containing protein, partial [Bacteroidota bacterium]